MENPVNCWKALRAQPTLPAGDRPATRETGWDWVISSQASVLCRGRFNDQRLIAVVREGRIPYELEVK